MTPNSFAQPIRSKVRLVASDLDGTVVQHDGSMTPRTVAALAAVEDAGAHLVFVTGRPPRWMFPVVEATGHRGVAICANGGVIYDLHTETVLEEFCLAADTAQQVVKQLRQAMPAAGFAVEWATGFHHDPNYAHPWPDDDMREVSHIEDVLDRPITKLLIRDRTSDSDAMMAAAIDLLGDLVTVTHSNPDECLLEISAPGVTKGSTLAALATRLGVRADEVLAFGDQPNDLAMLRWAGRGYAMGNGHRDVLDAVSRHTKSVAEDGVALVIEHLLRDGIIG